MTNIGEEIEKITIEPRRIKKPKPIPVPVKDAAT